MADVIWAMIVGPLMWAPGINIIVGSLAGGWPGFFVGLGVTVFMSGGGNAGENVRRTTQSTARKAKSNVRRAAKAWWHVLGVEPNASRDDVLKAYRDKAKAAHPDRGGSTAKMVEINRARDEALKSNKQ
jgi:hypothetical protein